MAEILAIGATDQSADFTIASGDVKTIALTSTMPPIIPDCSVQLLQKHGSAYYIRGEFNERMSSAAIDTPGTWAVKRVRGDVGVELD